MLGKRLAHYEITGRLGKGGMGEVYRATDTKLKREVAVKVLPDDFAQSVDRLARFQREAHALAALNHPNISAIYGMEESDGVRCLILELVEGETLGERISRGPLPFPDAMSVLRQISSALEAAHDKGIVHRDLKPENVKLLPEGSVKVLDFGLAKAFQNDHESTANTETSSAPTVELERTEEGLILGTIPYMSPEQARGAPVDKRTDIWSLGCVAYECLVGRRLFDGATSSDLLAQVLSQELQFDALHSETPSWFRRLLTRCLERDPKKRLRDAGEFRILVEEFEAKPDSELLESSPANSRSRFAAVPWVIAVLSGAALIATLARTDPPQTQQEEPSLWTIPLPPGARLGLPGPGGRFDYSGLIAIAPDGSRIAFAVQDQARGVELYLREMNSSVARPIVGTRDARAPFFSPDGQWLGFLADGLIQKVALSGGAPQTVCDIGRPVSFDACWSPDGESMVFATDDGLWRVSASGGEVEQLTHPDTEGGEVGHHAPRFLEDGSGVLFTISATPSTHLALLSLETLTWKIVLDDAAQGLVVADDLLLFARSGELLTVSFDVGRGTVEGPAKSVLQGIYTSPGLGGLVLTQFDYSPTGMLAYLPATVTQPTGQLIWVDRDGVESEITSGPGTWVHPRLSPDGQRISLDIHSPDGMRDVHIYELARGQMRRLTDAGISWESEWRPEGESIVIMSGAPAGQWSLFVAPTDFSGPPALLHRGDHAVPAQWLPGDAGVLFSDISAAEQAGGIWRVATDGKTAPDKILNSSARERHPRVSKDGKWIAYTADGSSRREVFVRSFPDLGPTHQISIDGGGEPLWSFDGSELFFREGDRVFAVDLQYDPFRAEAPRLLFSGVYDSAPLTGHQHYEVSADDQRFLMIKHGDPVGPNELIVALNWAAGLEETR